MKTTNVLKTCTFNLEWYGKKGFEKDDEALFALLKSADVIGVQEVFDAELFREMAEAHLGSNWKLEITDHPQQKVGLLYNSDVVECEEVKVLEEVNIGGRIRPGLLGEFVVLATGVRFAVIVVHLKSGADTRNVIRRRQQWKLLVRIVGELDYENVIVLGDMNCFTKQGEHLSELDPFIRATGFTLATAGGSYDETCKYGGRIDHILLSPALADSLAGVAISGPCAEDCPEEDCAAYWDKVSDHCPVYAGFSL